tara:strand:+ start:327 stop:530 length:204 start_codon:yes stop_codon:yes gene_type:complete
MLVEMTETTFNIVGSLLTSDLSIPVKDAGAYAQAQAEWARHVENIKTKAALDEVIEPDRELWSEDVE